MTQIPSIKSIIAARNKLLGRPTEIDLSAFSTQPSRAMPSRYVYKPASEYSFKAALADAGAAELRRQAGQNQSMTNYYDSKVFYENQSRLFRPLADEEEKTREAAKKAGTQAQQELANITGALGYKKDAAGNQQSFLGDLLNLMKGERDARVKQDEEATVKLQPVVINKADVAAYFAHKDISKDPLFDLFIDGDQLGGMLVLSELGLEEDIYFMLLPEHKQEYNMIRCVNAKYRVHHDQWLSRELIQLLTQNITMSEPVEVKVQYMEMINFAIGHELNQLSDSFRKGIDEKFQSADKYMQEEIKLQAAKRITDWANRSIKFSEWIAPAYNIDINAAKDFITQIDTDATTTPKQSGEHGLDEPRTRKPPDVYSPAKELEREKELKAATKSKTKIPAPTAPARKRDPTATAGIPSTPGTSGDGIPNGVHGIKMKVIVIAPDAEDRFKRLQVLLGSKLAGNNADTLHEFTSILDSLLSDGKIDKTGYKKYLRVFQRH